MSFGNDLNRENIQPLDLERLKRTDSHNSSDTNNNLSRLNGETQHEYMGRIVHALSPSRTDDMAGTFIREAIKSTHFAHIVNQLDTLKIADSYSNTFLEIVLKNGNTEKIHNFAQAMLGKDSMSLSNVKDIKNILERDRKLKGNTQFSELENQLEEIINKESKNDFSIAVEIEKTIDAVIKSGDPIEKKYADAQEKLAAQRISSPGTVILAVLASHIEPPLNDFELRFLHSIVPHLKKEELEFIVNGNISEVLKAQKIYLPKYGNNPPELSPLEILTEYRLFTIIDQIDDQLAKKGEHSVIENFQEWKLQEPQSSHYKFRTAINELRIQNKIELDAVIAYFEIKEALSQTVKQSLHFTPGKEGDKGIVARHPPETKALRQQAKQHLISWIEGELQLQKLKNDYVKFLEANSESNLENFKERFKEINEKYIIEIKGDKYEFLSSNSIAGVIKNNTEFAYLADNRTPSITPKLIASIFKGNRFEKVLISSSGRHEGTEFWSKWDNNIAWSDYSDIIHPVIKEAVLRIIQHASLKHPTILEVGGGTGRFARALIDKINENDKCEYFLLEYNDNEIAEARTALKDDASVVKTDIVEDRQFYQDSQKTRPIVKESIDMAIASGVLTTVVLKDKVMAIKALRKIHEYLKPNGYMVLAGHADSLLNAEDFENNGFRVINKGMPGHAMELYILQKKTGK